MRVTDQLDDLPVSSACEDVDCPDSSHCDAAEPRDWFLGLPDWPAFYKALKAERELDKTKR